MTEQELAAIEARVRELDEATAAWLAIMFDPLRYAGPPGDVDRRYDQARTAIRAHGERDVPALVAEVRRLRAEAEQCPLEHVHCWQAADYLT